LSIFPFNYITNAVVSLGEQLTWLVKQRWSEPGCQASYIRAARNREILQYTTILSL